MTPNRLRLDCPWLSFDLGASLRVLSWTLNRPGFVTANQIVWREVRNADLPKELDVRAWLDAELARHDAQDSVAFLTSCAIERFQTAHATIQGAEAFAVATVGLSNAERVGFRQPARSTSYGTINIAVQVNTPLSDTGLIEAMSIAVQARTAAVMEARIPLSRGHDATGTGTDCLAVAAPRGDLEYCGLHTPIGEAIGSAVYRAVAQGVKDWQQSFQPSADM